MSTYTLNFEAPSATTKTIWFETISEINAEVKAYRGLCAEAEALGREHWSFWLHLYAGHDRVEDCKAKIANVVERANKWHTDFGMPNSRMYQYIGDLVGALEELREAVGKVKEGLDESRTDKASREERRQNRGSDYRSGVRKTTYPTAVTEQAMRMLRELGYRECIRRCHPDKGGSHEDMVSVNATRDYMDSRGMQYAR